MQNKDRLRKFAGGTLMLGSFWGELKGVDAFAMSSNMHSSIGYLSSGASLSL